MGWSVALITTPLFAVQKTLKFGTRSHWQITANFLQKFVRRDVWKVDHDDAVEVRQTVNQGLLHETRRTDLFEFRNAEPESEKGSRFTVTDQKLGEFEHRSFIVNKKVGLNPAK